MFQNRSPACNGHPSQLEQFQLSGVEGDDVELTILLRLLLIRIVRVRAWSCDSIIGDVIPYRLSDISLQLDTVGFRSCYYTYVSSVSTETCCCPIMIMPMHLSISIFIPGNNLSQHGAGSSSPFDKIPPAGWVFKKLKLK